MYSAVSEQLLLKNKCASSVTKLPRVPFPQQLCKLWLRLASDVKQFLWYNKYHLSLSTNYDCIEMVHGDQLILHFSTAEAICSIFMTATNEGRMDPFDWSWIRLMVCVSTTVIFPVYTATM